MHPVIQPPVPVQSPLVRGLAILASHGLAVKHAYGIVAVRTFQALSSPAEDCHSLDQ
jgi:hypothetical protein